MMRRELLHICGPFSIYSYGVALAMGILVFVWLCLRDPIRKKLISSQMFIEVVCISLLLGLFGARLLFIFTSWNRIEHNLDIFNIFNGGLSLFGGILAIVIGMPFYLKKIKVPILPLLDLAALYAPVLHTITRLGCFMAGCCYGKPSTLPWAITYTDLQSEAPLSIALHPTQLYSSLASLGLFLFLYFVAKKYTHKPGQMLMLYLMFESIIRFSVDFFRADTEYYNFDQHYFSAYQWIALGVFGISLCGFIFFTFNKLTKLTFQSN